MEKVREGSLSSIKDANGNPMDPKMGNIISTNTFAKLDLPGASTSFKFRVNDIVCSDETISGMSSDIESRIASMIGLSSTSRVKVTELECLSSDTVLASALVSPQRRSTQEDHKNGSLRILSEGNEYDAVHL